MVPCIYSPLFLLVMLESTPFSWPCFQSCEDSSVPFRQVLFESLVTELQNSLLGCFLFSMPSHSSLPPCKLLLLWNWAYISTLAYISIHTYISIPLWLTSSAALSLMLNFFTSPISVCKSVLHPDYTVWADLVLHPVSTFSHSPSVSMDVLDPSRSNICHHPLSLQRSVTSSPFPSCVFCAISFTIQFKAALPFV